MLLLSFCSAQRSETCGGTFYIPRSYPKRYEITTPNYPQNYPNDIRCEWNFILALPEPYGYAGSNEIDEYQLAISFPGSIDVEYHPTCVYDAIEVTVPILKGLISTLSCEV